MAAEFGYFALVLALCFAVLLTILPAWGVFRNHTGLMASASHLAIAQLVFVAISFACLVYAFLGDDFTVKLVTIQSNTKLPDAYKFSAVWGGHEGSLLLWVLILSGWTAAVALASRSLPLDILARVLCVMGAIAVGFLGFSLFTSNPFERTLMNPPLDGQDLNPLLQDPGMVIHPPMLYFGYVGFSVAFAFAIAALWSGRLDASWARWARPWTNIAWAFLGVGITLGSWWAYYELGWGGWWFWDPVENASFMPWLVGTALVHSLAVTEKRGLFKSWTVLLAIFAFSFSLLGTFLVRSGVLTSVHAFAADPTRGFYILGFLAIVVGGSLTLFAFRAPARQKDGAAFTGWARELLLLLNNVIFVVAALTVLLGTLYPLAMDFAGYGKYSVGPPYFNSLFVPLMALLAALMGFAPASRWRQSGFTGMSGVFVIAAIASVITGLLAPYLSDQDYSIAVALAVTLAAWILYNAAYYIYQQATRGGGLARLRASWWGMQVAHFGFAVCLLGVCVVSNYTVEQDISMSVGESREMATGLDVKFEALQDITGPNYAGQAGRFIVTRNGKLVADLSAEKRRYHARGDQVMTEAAIDAGFLRDIYIAMGEPVGDGAWAVRLHYKPLVRWMWLGGVLMALGGVIAVTDRRYRLAVKRSLMPNAVAAS